MLVMSAQPSDPRCRFPSMLVVTHPVYDRGALSRLLCLAYRDNALVDGICRAARFAFKSSRRLIGSRIALAPSISTRPSCRLQRASQARLPLTEWRQRAMRLSFRLAHFVGNHEPIQTPPTHARTFRPMLMGIRPLAQCLARRSSPVSGGSRRSALNGPAGVRIGLPCLMRLSARAPSAGPSALTPSQSAASSQPARSILLALLVHPYFMNHAPEENRILTTEPSSG